MWTDRTKIALSEKKIFQKKKFADTFLYVKLGTVQISRQTNKFPLSFSSLKRPLQVKKIDLRKQH